MSSLSMVESNLPPGFRFHPKDEELVCDYLMKKVTCSDQPSLMIEVDLNKSEPWDIPVIACVGGKEWYFYSQRDKKYATGLRTNRATISGYWKATGKDRAVFSKGTLVGMRKTLVFYQGRAPKGKKMDWVIHEFRLAGPNGPLKISSNKEEDWVLCRMFYKNKEMHAKQETRNLCYGEIISSTLSPLMEPYIKFNQDYEQMPHVSIFNPDQTTPTTNISQNTHNSMSSSCDNEALEAVLDHIVMNEYSHSYGEGSSESFLSEVGGLVDAMWSHF